MMMNEPLPGQDVDDEPTEAQLEKEGAAFMAAMQMHASRRG